MKLISVLLLFMMFLVFACSDVPYTGPMLTVDDVDRYLNSTGEDTVCLQDGFDSICVQLVPGPTGADGTDGKDGRDGTDGNMGPPGLPGRDGTTTIVHVYEFSFIEHKAEKPTAAASLIVAEAVSHSSGTVHPIPAETQTEADHVVHVSNLTPDTHETLPDDNAIWHIDIHDNPNSVELYVYPRSMPLDQRLDFYPGTGTELQGTRKSVNQMLRMYLKEHNTHVSSILGEESVVDNDLKP